MSRLRPASPTIAWLVCVTLSFVTFSSFGALLLESASANSRQRVRWRPNPKMGSARSTLSGGRRGQAIAHCEINRSTRPIAKALLVPQGEQSLLTTAANPTLFWYTETDRPVTARFILSDPTVADPVLTQTVEIDRTGVTRVALPAGVTLKSGVRYRWTVLLACGGGTSGEVAIRSFVERVEDAELLQRVQSQSLLDRAASFAAAGIWYDAIAALMDATQQDPENSHLKEELRSLLLQVGRPQTETAQVVNAVN